MTARARRTKPCPQTEIALGEHGLTFRDPASNMGVRDLGLRLTVEGRVVDVRYGTVAKEAGSVSAEGAAGADLKVSTTVERVAGLEAAILRHALINAAPRPILVNAPATGAFAATAGVLPGKSHGLGWDLRYGHTDNVRTERYPHCQMEYPYVRMLPVHPVRLGAGEDQAFPGLFLLDLKGRSGLVIAAASQRLNYTVFECSKAAFTRDSAFDSFAIVHDPGQCAGFEVPAGGRLELDGVFLQLVGDRAPDEMFRDYLDVLAARHVFRGGRSAMRREALHCTWNYGVFADQREAPLIETARFIAARLPAIRWFLMDAGYLRQDGGMTFLDMFYPDPDRHVDPVHWPRGIRGFNDALRSLGLRPGLWWSPTVRVPSRLYEDHPDWFLRRADGSLYLIGGKNAFLDYTHPESLAFLDRTLAAILGGWGMDACKMDFWSQNFEDRHARLRDPRVTSVQARAAFFDVVRRHLPPDGVFMTCVATGMGNPFVGEWADTYRNTIDIGVGQWHEQVANCIWALPTLGFAGSKSLLLNNDSAGIMAEYPDNENLFRLTWSFMHQGMIETGGRMETWPEKWVAAMRRLTDRCDRGYAVRCPDERAFTGVPLPEALFVDYPPESPTAKAGIRQSVALFNWSDEPRLLAVRRARLGHGGPVRAVDFWSGTEQTLDGEFLSLRLDGRSAALYDIAAAPPHGSR